MPSRLETTPLPFPPNPNYGQGVTRRRIDLINEDCRTVARLTDPFHEMECELVCEGTRLATINGVMRRYPTTLCPGANASLQAFVGLDLLDAAKQMYAPASHRGNCTHLLDLAWLATQHAVRSEVARTYEACVPDEQGGASVVAELRRNGEVVHRWNIDHGLVTAPANVQGLPLLKGFWANASARFDRDDLEAAMVLARAYLIAIGRAYDTQAWAGRSVKDNTPLRDRCYAYSSDRLDAGYFLAGHVRDFSDQIPPAPSYEGKNK
jgi:hypothetical protein